MFFAIPKKHTRERFKMKLVCSGIQHKENIYCQIFRDTYNAWYPICLFVCFFLIKTHFIETKKSYS